MKLALLLFGAAAAAQPLLIRGGTLIDGTVRQADLLIADGRIQEEGVHLKPPAGAQVIDARGKSILPGLFDLHTHVPYPSVGGSAQDWGKNLKAYLRAGVTSLADFGTYPETYEPVRRLLGEGIWQGPQVHFAARFSTPGGHGVEGGRGDFFTQEVLTPKQAHAAMARVLPYKPDVIKVFTDGWRYANAPDMTSMEETTLRAIVEDAHRAGIPVLTHTVTLAKGKIAARAGVDAIMHGIQDQPVDEELIRLMKDNHVAYGPTATVYEPRAGYMQSPLLDSVLEPAALALLKNRPMLAAPSPQRQQKYELLRANTAALFRAGIVIVSGTDAGITGTHHGWASLREITLLSEAGLGPVEAIRAATRNAAQVVRSRERGELTPGKIADLLIVDGRPDERIGDIEKVDRVVQSGRLVDVAALTQAIRNNGPTPTPERIAPALLDDFESTNGRSRLDTRWINATDTGQDRTEMIYQRVPRSDGGHALSFQAKFSDSAAPYARMNLPLTRGAVEPMDASAYAGVEFDVRGEGRYSLRVQGASYSFTAATSWNSVRIPFAGKVDTGRLTMLAFEMARPGGERSWVELDNIRFYAAGSSALLEEEIPASRRYREASYGQFLRFAERLEREKDKEPLRREFQTKVGYPPPGFVGPYRERMEKIGEDAIATYYRAWAPVSPEMEVYGLYLVPRNRTLPAPLVIAQHGGGGYPELALFKGGGNYKDMIRGAAKEGYVVWAPLLLMHPFRDRDTGTPIPAEVRRDMDAAFRKLGTSLMGVETMRISRSLDVMIRRPEVDPQRVGMIGLSYGGYFTLYTMAVDPRIKVGVASCSIRDREATKAAVPEGRPVDMPGSDLAALIAPRALQIQNGVKDEGLPIDMVRRAAAEAQTHYAPGERSSSWNSTAGTSGAATSPGRSCASTCNVYFCGSFAAR
ncbi:MAG TPA: amidohydrolase family protein [Bryobacteraceae bacterium]|nr:amidohydrolase family protein [Bryobacteraceae bacterium]